MKTRKLTYQRPENGEHVTHSPSSTSCGPKERTHNRSVDRQVISIANAPDLAGNPPHARHQRAKRSWAFLNLP